MKSLLTILLLFGFLAGCVEKIETKIYEDKFPFKIVEDDRETVEAIEFIFKQVSEKAKKKNELNRFRMSWVTKYQGVSFYPNNNHDEVWFTFDNSKLTINNRDFTSNKTRLFFKTFYEFLLEADKGSRCGSVEMVQYATMVYSSRTIIEFNCDPNYVVLNCFSNRPHLDIGDKVYILDVVSSEESYFPNEIELERRRRSP